MKLDMAQIQKDYDNSRGWREAQKYAFAIGTFGLGALYLWATTSIIKQGEIGLRRNHRGEMILLPPGRHSNFPWESYPVGPQSLSEKIINLGPYKIITVETGYIAKTLKKGVLEILEAGQHLLQEASHVFDSFIPVKQETRTLHAVTASTSDNVELTIHADVRYQIKVPNTAICKIDDIDKSITEIAKVSIAQIVSHHNLEDFAPVTNVGQTNSIDNGIGKVIDELMGVIQAQLLKLGITLLNIGITSWSVNNKQLAHELAQGAVIKSQAESKMLSAKREAEVMAISTEAKANAVVKMAESEAAAIKLKGAAFKESMEGLDSAAQNAYLQSQNIELVRGTNNPNLFFYQPTGGAPLPQVTVPVTPTATV